MLWRLEIMDKFSKLYEVKNFQCGADARLRFGIIFNILQDIADLNANSLGFGYDFCLQNNLGWVSANYHLKINEIPNKNEEFTLTTWISETTLVSSIREFQAKNKLGKELFRASSQWALVNLKTKRPVKISDNLLKCAPIPEKMIQTSFPAIAIPDNYQHEYNFFVKYDEIDLYQHVNNSFYPLWASEAVPFDFRESHTISEIEISYKKPAVYKDEIKIKTYLQENESLHLICNKNDEKNIFSKVKIIWK